MNALSSSAVVGLREAHISGFRSARHVTFAPGRLCALVGEANTGKSNVLTAIWTLLEPQAPAPTIEDVFHGGWGEICIGATLADGSECSLEALPPAPPIRAGTAPPVIFLLADERTGPLLARPLGASAIARKASHVIEGAPVRSGACSSAAPALAFVGAIEECCGAGIRGLVLLIEEPELYLRPQAALPLPAAARLRGGWQPGALLDARARLPQRRSIGGVGAGRASRRCRYGDRPARSPCRRMRASGR